jgi:hypothetical protein
VRDFRHPLVGGLSLNEEVMQLIQDAGQRVVLYSADPGSPSEAGLRLLAGLTAEQSRLQPTQEKEARTGGPSFLRPGT